MSKIRRKRAAWGTAALAAAALTGAGLHSAFVTTEHALAEQPADTAVAAAPAHPAARTAAREMSEAFADLAASTTPAVVRIEVRLPADRTSGTDLQDIPEPFRPFFRFPGPQNGEPAPRFASGTGFLVSGDGYIVTNAHVAGDADEITVTLYDHRSFKADLVGSDPTTDVAVIKIDADDLPHLTWGSSSGLRVGEWVMAVGNPGYGATDQLDYTVTTGIVSGKGRPLQLLSQGLAQDPDFGAAKAGYAIEDFIQTDAVINPGNSGGPLVNLDGQVVGVNSAIASTDGHYQGYGFAIPADLVKKVAGDLMKHGKVERAWLGVEVTGVSPEDAEAFHLPAVRGVVVQGVTDGSPADDAGLKMGDVIMSVDGKTIESGGGLQVLIATHSQGDDVDVRYYRDGEAHTTTVHLGEAPITENSRPASERQGSAGAASRKLGLSLSDLDAPTARRLGYEDGQGVVVSEVDPVGPAGRRAIAPGTKLLRIDRQSVTSADQATGILDKVESGDVVSLLVEAPSGQRRIVNIRAR